MSESRRHPNPRTDTGFEVPDHVIYELDGTAGNASAAGELIGTQEAASPSSPPEITSVTETWAQDSLFDAIESWNEAIWFQDKQHWAFDDVPIPEGFNDLRSSNQNFDAGFRILCHAKERLMAFGETEEGKTPGGENIGDTMGMVLVPWGFFARELSRERSLMHTLVELHGFDDFETEVMENLHAGNVRYFLGGMSVSSEQYLASRMAQDGNWGVMLMQTSEQPGIAVQDGVSDTLLDTSFINMSPAKRIEIGGVNIGSFGIFEAIALRLQESVRDPQDMIWLPANHFTDEDVPHPNASHMSATRQLMERLRGTQPSRRQVRLAVEPGENGDGNT